MIQLLASPIVWVGGVAVALGIAAGVQTVRLASAQSDIWRISAQHDKERAALDRKAREALEAQKIEAEEIAEKQAEVLNEGIEQYKAMADNERAARLASERLRNAERSRGGAGQQGPTAAAPSQSASSPADLSAYVSRRLDEATDGIALHADDTFVRSDACERIYEALRPHE